MSASDPAYPYEDPPRLPAEDRVDLNAWLPGSGPLEIELGPGRGAFLLARAAAHPELRLLGMEIRRKWATQVDDRLAHQGWAERARVVCEDARVALPRLGPEASVARVFVHFPDPWWKKRHQKRLLVVDPLMSAVCHLLVDGGAIFVQTDVDERAEQYEQVLRQRLELEPAGDQPGSATLMASPYDERSNRERRVEADGLPVYRLRFRRASRGVVAK